MDEHIRESIQRYTVGQTARQREEEEKVKHTYSQCALDRSNRTSREDEEDTGLSEKPSLRRNRIV